MILTKSKNGALADITPTNNLPTELEFQIIATNFYSN